MTKKATHRSKRPPHDRRSGKDRRRLDAPPPGGRDRRREIESRKPEVVEVELSPSDWAAFSAAMPLRAEEPGSSQV
ncbi:MAG: hypothetical protein ABIX46_10740 [Burkholderiaceae bacterium]